ncbi:MAG: hypothetical protein IJN92_04585 [Lachnospiraceae bacterium]|nr:hypothetical protein [Lachnospiraceae bacterium]
MTQKNSYIARRKKLPYVFLLIFVFFLSAISDYTVYTSNKEDFTVINGTIEEYGYEDTGKFGRYYSFINAEISNKDRRIKVIRRCNDKIGKNVCVAIKNSDIDNNEIDGTWTKPIVSVHMLVLAAFVVSAVILSFLVIWYKKVKGESIC